MLPLCLFPDSQNNAKSCDLFAINHLPLTQVGELDLTLQFHCFPHRKFVHTFILADISTPILGLDFLHKHHMIIDTRSFAVSINDEEPSCLAVPKTPDVNVEDLSLLEILELFPDLTSGHIHVDKKLHPFEHTIDVDGPPKAFRPRRLNPEKKRELNRQLDEMLEKKIIKSSTSPWASPVHLVKKKDDSYRLVIDYRFLNNQTRRMNYPLPRIQDFTAHVHGCNIFSSLDLKSAFWQLDVRPSDRKYTCFSTHRGNFEFNKMPFGLTYASSSFQQFINHVLQHTESFCFAFIDDLFIFSPDLASHKRHLLEIANRLNAYGLTLNMSKTSLGLSEIEVLGYHLSANGILPLQDKVAAIKKFPKPKSVKSLRRFLGMVTYQRRFIKNAAELLQPLNDLLHGKVQNNDPVMWTNSAEQAFIVIKEALSNVCHLAHPKESAQLYLRCDASGIAVGSVLEQLDDDEITPLGYFSKALNGPQKRYSTYDLELLSAYLSVKYFEHLLLDKHFILFTDHKSLVNSFYKPSENHSPRQVRYLSYLSQFDCEIKHIPGHKNVAADCLSRVIIQHVLERDQLPFSASDLAKAQAACPDLSFPPDSSIIVQQEPIPNSDLSVLVDVSQGHPRPILPPELQDKVVWHYHNLHHPGIRATQKLVKHRYVFTDMNRRIRDLVRTCTACQRSKVHRHTVSPIASIPMPTARFTKLQVDICGPFPSSQNCSYLLVCVDPFTRWVEAYPMHNQSTDSVISALAQHVQHFGTFSCIHSDSGSQFTSSLFRDFCRFLGAEHRLSNIRYPQSNGLAERYIKTIKTALTAKLDRQHWTRHVPLIILSINNMYKSDLKCSSAELVYGQTLRLPGDLCFDTPQPASAPFDDVLTSMRQFANSCKPISTRVCQSNRVHLPDSLSSCSHVYIKVDPIKPNLTPSYDGPFLVMSRTDSTFNVLRHNQLYSVAINNVKPAYTLPPPHFLHSFPFTEPTLPHRHSDSQHYSSTYNLRHAPPPQRYQDYVVY